MVAESHYPRFLLEDHGMASRTRILAGTSKPPWDAERRENGRTTCHRRATCRPITGPANLTWQATVWDASPGGIGLTTAVPFEPGTVLAVHFHLGEDRPPLTKLMVVRHVRAEADESWAVGGFFVHPLSRQQMEALR